MFVMTSWSQKPSNIWYCQGRYSLFVCMQSQCLVLTEVPQLNSLQFPWFQIETKVTSTKERMLIFIGAQTELTLFYSDMINYKTEDNLPYCSQWPTKDRRNGKHRCWICSQMQQTRECIPLCCQIQQSIF